MTGLKNPKPGWKGSNSELTEVKNNTPGFSFRSAISACGYGDDNHCLFMSLPWRPYGRAPTLGNSIGRAKPSTDERSILNLIHLLVKWGNRLVSGLNYSECDLDAIDRIQNPWWLCHNGWDLNVIEMASSSQGDNCLIFPVPLYTVTIVGIIKSYESFVSTGWS